MVSAAMLIVTRHLNVITNKAKKVALGKLPIKIMSWAEIVTTQRKPGCIEGAHGLGLLPQFRNGNSIKPIAKSNDRIAIV